MNRIEASTSPSKESSTRRHPWRTAIAASAAGLAVIACGSVSAEEVTSGTPITIVGGTPLQIEKTAPLGGDVVVEVCPEDVALNKTVGKVGEGCGLVLVNQLTLADGTQHIPQAAAGTYRFQPGQLITTESRDIAGTAA